MLTEEELRDLCLKPKGAEETFPFGTDVRVFKVMGKMFALLPVNSTELSISLKCDPTQAQILRATYPAIKAGYHLNKEHWNSVFIDGTVPDDEIRAMIEDSYHLVVKGLTKKQREALEKS